MQQAGFEGSNQERTDRTWLGAGKGPISDQLTLKAELPEKSEETLLQTSQEASSAKFEMGTPEGRSSVSLDCSEQQVRFLQSWASLGQDLEAIELKGQPKRLLRRPLLSLGMPYRA